jgi:predicted  nucleic acid-binding Zn-ribbon protein
MGELRDAARNPRELRRLVGVLQRAVRRLPTLEGELTSSRQTAATLQTQVREQQRALVTALRLISELEQTLGAILGIRHGKRTDRRLARAQRTAQKALNLVQQWHADTPPLALPTRRRRRPRIPKEG